MKILSRYLAAEFIVPFVVCSVFFVVFLLTFQMVKLVGLIINKDVALELVMQMMGHLALTFLPLSIPMAILFASVFFLNRLSEDSELVVMRSLGMSRFKMFMPLFWVGITIAVLSFCLNISIIPYSKKEFRRIFTLLSSRGFLSDIEPAEFYQQIPGVTIFANEVGGEGDILSDVFINFKNDKIIERKDESQTIAAKKGVLLKYLDQNTGRLEIKFHLYDGNIVNEKPLENKIEKIEFGEYFFKVPLEDFTIQHVTKDSMLTTNELWRLKSLTQTEQETAKISARDMAMTEIELWSRFNNSFLAPIFVFIGFGVGVQSARGRRSNSSLRSFLVLVIYYALFFFGVSLAQKGSIDASWAVFVPTTVVLLLGIYWYRKLEWAN